MSALGALIRQKREREGLSLREAGAASGVAFSTLGRIENGGETTVKIAQRVEAWLNGEAPILAPPPMTLRDWFAGQVLSGMLASEAGIQPYPHDWAAQRAFLIADAMLAERKKGPTHDQ